MFSIIDSACTGNVIFDIFRLQLIVEVTIGVIFIFFGIIGFVSGELVVE